MERIRLIQSVYDNFKNPLDFLENYEFSKLTYLSQYHLILLVFLARRNNKYLPKDPTWLKEQIRSPHEVELKPYMGVWFEKYPPLGATYNENGVLETVHPGDAEPIKTEYSKKKADELGKFNREEGFEWAWGKYPWKIGKQKAFISYKKSVKNIDDHAKLITAMAFYTTWLEKLKVSGVDRLPLDGKTFFNNWKDDYENRPVPDKVGVAKGESFQAQERRKFLEEADK